MSTPLKPRNLLPAFDAVSDENSTHSITPQTPDNGSNGSSSRSITPPALIQVVTDHFTEIAKEMAPSHVSTTRGGKFGSFDADEFVDWPSLSPKNSIEKEISGALETIFLPTEPSSSEKKTNGIFQTTILNNRPSLEKKEGELAAPLSSDSNTNNSRIKQLKTHKTHKKCVIS